MSVCVGTHRPRNTCSTCVIFRVFTRLNVHPQHPHTRSNIPMSMPGRIYTARFAQTLHKIRSSSGFLVGGRERERESISDAHQHTNTHLSNLTSLIRRAQAGGVAVQIDRTHLRRTRPRWIHGLCAPAGCVRSPSGWKYKTKTAQCDCQACVFDDMWSATNTQQYM